MTLPLSGTLGMNDIRSELGIPTQAPFSLASASLGIYVSINQNSFYRPTPSAPFTISSWYGYNHAASASPSPTPSITISPSRTPSITPSISISATPSITPSISISNTPSLTPSISISATPSVTPSISISATPSITPSISISRTPSVTLTPSPSPDTCPTDYTYRYLRWKVTAIRSTSPDNLVQASEFRVRNNNAVVAWNGSATATNPGGSNPVGEGPQNLLDSNTSTKWLDSNLASNGYALIVIDNTVGITFSGYDYVTANDSNNRDAISWTLEGSNDGTNYTLLDIVSNATITTSRFTATQTFCIPTTLPSPTPSITPSITISPSVTPSISISATPSLTPSISISKTPSVTPSISISTTPSVTPSISISQTPSVTPSISISATPSITPSISISKTPSVTPSISISATPSVTPSISISATPSITPSISISKTPSITPSISISKTPSITPSISISATPSVTPSVSISRTPSITPSISISKTPSVTPSISISRTPSITPSISISKTPSVTPSISISRTPTPSPSSIVLGSTLGYTVYAYGDGFGDMYYNASNHTHYSTFVSDVIDLIPAADQYLNATAVDYNGFGAFVNLFINNAFITYAFDSYSAYLDLYTSAGNDYYFEISFGGA